MSIVYTYEYDTSYNPAMPVVEIVIGRALGERSLTLVAVVDTGADATIIPVRQLRQVSARRQRKAWMRAPMGTPILVDTYAISVQLGAFTQAHLEVVGNTWDDETLVGRDILNHLSLTLNGPAYSVIV